jgi:hypothetical protein
MTARVTLVDGGKEGVGMTGHGAGQRRMILAAGMQSGGTPLLSWCFLPRRDIDGVLDMAHDAIQVALDRVAPPIVWVKMTVGAFRWLDVAEVYRDLGWEPEPLLLVPDICNVLASLVGKGYGYHGATADSPPLRFRRFLRDWQLFQDQGWPILRFEDVLDPGRGARFRPCAALRLPWDEGMVSWPKRLSDLAYVGTPNRTFARTIARGSLETALLRDQAEVPLDHLRADELDWLERAFAACSAIHRYALHVALSGGPPTAACAPLRPDGRVRRWARRAEHWGRALMARPQGYRPLRLPEDGGGQGPAPVLAGCDAARDREQRTRLPAGDRGPTPAGPLPPPTTAPQTAPDPPR